MKLLYFSICVVFVSACKQHQTCRDCIRDFKGCVWCASEKVSGQRCMSNDSVPENWCPDEIQNPGSTIDVVPSVSYKKNLEDLVQIRPRIIEMSLRPGQTVDFNFTYTPARNYPVDIYFLYDASINLEYWEKLKDQTKRIIDWMKSKTSNASIGFGTFIDKNALPFISIQNESLSYSFKHQFKLSPDTENFKKALEEVQIVNSVFIDDIHGGLDALAQVIVCLEVGWRDISRKVVVLASDNLYHAAGDGKAAGIFKPYDGECYMNNGTYTNELHMDYPSIQMINKLASDQKVTIFFVIDSMVQSYNSIKQVINGAHIIPSKKTKHQEISVASKLQDTYTSITEIIKMKKDINPIYKNKINVVFDPDCSSKAHSSSSFKKCKVELEKEKTFRGQITVLEYFEADDIKVDISMIGIKDKLTLKIKLISECNCTAGDDKLCHGGGKRQCGVCACNPNRSGINCECSTTNAAANTNKSTCMVPGSQIECSGRGSCVCGFCKCAEKRYRGKYCDCDDEFCPKDKNGQLCGHGRCQCGECLCEEGWTKTLQRTCNCEASNTLCRTGNYECSDYGRCECNKCECKSPFCEWDARSTQGVRCNPLPCEDCHARQCLLLQPYALNDINDTPCKKRVNVTSIQKLDNKTDWMLCSDVRSTVGCYTKFIYRYDDEKYGIHLIVQSENDCAESYYIFGGTCIGGLVLMGILTLVVWKVVTVHRDRKEYRRFLLQHQVSLKRSAPQPNPLFNSANTSITNPNYRRRSIFH